MGLSLPAVETPRPTRKKKLGTYPFVSVVFSITLALFVLGVFGVMLIFSRELERSVRDNLNIQVYLKGTVTEKQRKQIRTDLASAYFTARKEN
ncbi:MAG: ABC transporter permease, partial [Cyclobacteriaceae bacterium]